jgi:hypothetical protein
LQFAVEIVRHDGREQPSLVGGASPAGDVAHLIARFLLKSEAACRSGSSTANIPHHVTRRHGAV